MIKAVIISENQEILNLTDTSIQLDVYNNISKLVKENKKIDIIFYIYKDNNFIEAYQELAEVFDNLTFIVVYEKIDIAKIKKGFKEGIYEFISFDEFKNQFKLIFDKAKEHVNIIRSKEKVYQYTKHEIFIEIPSDINLVNETVLQIIATGKVAGFIKNKKFENNIRLALTEGIVNAIVHGNKNDKRKKVKVYVSIDFNILKIRIVDMGKGFVFKDDINPFDKESLLKSSGRGIYLMKILMDEVSYDRQNKELTLIKYKNRKS